MTAEFIGLQPFSPPPATEIAPLYPPDNHYLKMLAITTIEQTEGSLTFASGNIRHQTQTINVSEIGIPGSIHRRLYSEPVASDNPPPYRIINILGYTESIDAPYIKKYHAELSDLQPNIPVSTEATYGIDGTGTDLALLKKLTLSHDKLAQRMFNVMKLTYPDLPIVMVATSQGASVYARICQLNEAEGNPLPIKDQVLYEPYVLTKEQKCARTLGKFMGGHIALDGARELLTHTDPRAVFEIWSDQVRSLPLIASNLAGLIGHGISNVRRTEHRAIADMLANGALIVQGSKDCLGCEDTNKLPGVELKTVSGKGHSMGMNPYKRARAIANVLKSRGH